MTVTARRLSIQLGLTWVATGVVLNALYVSALAAAEGRLFFEMDLIWALLRWSIWLVLVPPIVILALRTASLAVQIPAAIAASLAHSLIFWGIRIAAEMPVETAVRIFAERFWIDFAHDALIYASTVAACRADRFLTERRAIATEEIRLETATRAAEALAARNRLQPEEVRAALSEIASTLPHDVERAEERLDALAQSLRDRLAAHNVAAEVTPEPDEESPSALITLRLFLVGVVGLALGGVSLTILGGMAGAAAAFTLFDARAAHRRRMHAFELERRYAEAEERFLRARLEPHFLFNSLNSVAALIDSDRELAAIMLRKLGELYVTAFADHPTEISVAEEVALLERYLFVQGIRFRDRMNVSIECDQTVNETRVPSLLLQPLVENAVRHGIARRTTPGAIAVRIWRDGQNVRASVVNDLADDDGAASTRPGGVELTRARLLTRYGTRARFDVQRGDQTFAVEMRWPCAS